MKVNDPLAWLVFLGVFALVGYELYLGHDVKVEISAIVTCFVTIVGYKWGSSDGSRRKTELLAPPAPPQSPAAPAAQPEIRPNE